MADYEYLFSRMLQERLSQKINGTVHVEINEDTIVIYIADESRAIEYGFCIDGFAYKLVNGLTTSYVCDFVVKKYRNFLMNYFFK